MRENPLTTANDAWLLQANILRFELILNGTLTLLQREAMERLVAEQRAKLEDLTRSQGVE